MFLFERIFSNGSGEVWSIQLRPDEPGISGMASAVGKPVKDDRGELVVEVGQMMGIYDEKRDEFHVMIGVTSKLPETLRNRMEAEAEKVFGRHVHGLGSAFTPGVYIYDTLGDPLPATLPATATP